MKTLRRVSAQGLRILLRYSFFRYFLNSALGFGLSYSIFLILTTYHLCHYLLAMPIASYMTYPVSFWLHKLLSFSDKRKYSAAWQWPVDVGLALAWNPAMNDTLLFGVVTWYGLDPRYAQLVVVPYFLGQNYVLRRFVIFSPTVEAWVRKHLGVRSA